MSLIDTNGSGSGVSANSVSREKLLNCGCGVVIELIKLICPELSQKAID